MNALWRPEEMEYGLQDSGAKVLFADQERLERLADCSPELNVQVIAVRPSGHDERELWGLLDGMGEVEMPAADIQPDDPATIFYTSGSTGRPKGVVSSQRNIISALLSWELDGLVAARLMGIEMAAPASQPATLLAVPLFHVTGSHAIYLSSYRGQRKIVSMYKWDPQAAAGLIERRKITSFCGPRRHDRRPGPRRAPDRAGSFDPDDRRRRRRAARARTGQADRGFLHQGPAQYRGWGARPRPTPSAPASAAWPIWSARQALAARRRCSI